MPADIAALSELRILALDNNDLKAVPPAIGALPRLQSLLLRLVHTLQLLSLSRPSRRPCTGGHV